MVGEGGGGVGVNVSVGVGVGRSAVCDAVGEESDIVVVISVVAEGSAAT